MRVMVISDTHGMLRPELGEALRGCDAIIHAGDIDERAIIDELEQFAPLYVVRGNADREWASEIERTKRIELEGTRFFIIHNKSLITEELSNTDVVIYGHTHRYSARWKGRQLWLNPGSCGPRKRTQPITCAILELLGPGKLKVSRVDLPHFAESTGDLPSGMDVIVRRAMRDIDSGYSVADVAKRGRIPVELAERICRMYLTHPGVDVQGIIRRLG